METEVLLTNTQLATEEQITNSTKLNHPDFQLSFLYLPHQGRRIQQSPKKQNKTNKNTDKQTTNKQKHHECGKATRTTTK